MNIYAQLTQEYRIEAEREKRAKELQQQGVLQIVDRSLDHVGAVANVHHQTQIRRRSDGSLDVSCSCPDWKTRGMHTQRPCKHILALAMVADAQGLLSSGAPASSSAQHRRPDPPVPPPPPQAAGLRGEESFPDKVRKAVAAVVEQLADQVEAVLKQGGTPFLVGPTGCGKTSAVRLCATRNGWGFEEVAGLFSFADGDLVGLKTGNFEFAGVFARAFRRARGGEEMLLFLDELLRFNVRALDLLMRPLQEMSPTVAQAMGIATDPALVRRVEPIVVGMADRVAQLFETKIADAIQASWKAVERGELPLPVEYQSLLTAHAPDDATFLARYLTRLEVVDKAAADGYRHLLNGMSLSLTGGGHG